MELIKICPDEDLQEKPDLKRLHITTNVPNKRKQRELYDLLDSFNVSLSFSHYKVHDGSRLIDVDIALDKECLLVVCEFLQKTTRPYSIHEKPQDPNAF